MSRECYVCGKSQDQGIMSATPIDTPEENGTNIQTVRIDENGTVRRRKVCTRCIRSGKINRAI